MRLSLLRRETDASVSRGTRLAQRTTIPPKNVIACSIAFYLHPGHQLLDLAGPLDALRAANNEAGRRLYDLRVLSRWGGQVDGNGGVSIDTRPFDEAACDTLVVVGGGTERMRHPDEIMAVKHLAGDATRVLAVCTGAFLLAEAGLLDGRRATPHWACARKLQRNYPAVNVEPDRIFVIDGPVWTCAGITARKETDETPAKAVERLRVEAAHLRLQDGSEPIEVIAQAVGFNDPERMRRTFVKQYGQPAQALRRMAGPLPGASSRKRE